jgi:tetratricopeptide (TPR) repeat protein
LHDFTSEERNKHKHDCWWVTTYPDEAIAHLKSAIELEPRRPMTYQILGEVYEHLGRYADAISFHEKARAVRTLTFPGS